MNSSQKYVFVTYLSNDRDYKGTILLNYNLKKLNHKCKLVCVVLEDVSDKIRNILKKFNILLHEFNLRDILKEFNISENYCNYLINKHYYGKFLIFNLTDYDKIVYLDTDLLIKENIDNLFLYDTKSTIYMTYDIGVNGCDLKFRTDFNSGVIVLEPSIDTYKTCYSELANFENNLENLTSDQSIFYTLNKKSIINISYLDIKYNYVSMLGEKFYKNIKQDNPAIIHFTLFPKPWDFIDFNENILDYYMYSDPKIYFSEWLELYFDMVKNLLNELTKLDVYMSYNKIFFKDNLIEKEIKYT